MRQLVLPPPPPPAARLPRPRDRRRPCGSEPVGLIPPRGGGNVRRAPFATTNFVDRSEEAICQSEVKANAVKVRPSQIVVGSRRQPRGLMSGSKSPDSAPTTVS